MSRIIRVSLEQVDRALQGTVDSGWFPYAEIVEIQSPMSVYDRKSTRKWGARKDRILQQLLRSGSAIRIAIAGDRANYWSYLKLRQSGADCWVEVTHY
jgi:hypothetical protein